MTRISQMRTQRLSIEQADLIVYSDLSVWSSKLCILCIAHISVLMQETTTESSLYAPSKSRWSICLYMFVHFTTVEVIRHAIRWQIEIMFYAVDYQLPWFPCVKQALFWALCAVRMSTQCFSNFNDLAKKEPVFVRAGCQPCPPEVQRHCDELCCHMLWYCFFAGGQNAFCHGYCWCELAQKVYLTLLLISC